MQGLLGAFVEQGWRVTFLCAANESIHTTPTDADITFLSVNLNCSSFDVTIASLQPNVVIFDRFMTEEQFSWRVRENCPDAMLVLNTEDLHSLRQARYEAVKAGKPACHASLNTPLAQREIAAVLRSDLSLIISPIEYDLLINHYQVPSHQLLQLPLLMDIPQREVPDFAARKGFMTIGNFRHGPNWDAVLQLKQHIWPLIRKMLPEATLSIFGAYPPKKATALHDEKSGFLVKGWTDSAAEAISNARIMLAPLRYGAGVKGKLIQAMALGTPSVTTSIGAEGIGTAEQWPGLIIDSDTTRFAQAALTLYTDESHWQACQQRGFSLIHKQFNLTSNQHHLVAAVECVYSQLSAHRGSLFLQAMLWHHTLRSCQYMSQWIEEKNKNS
ncbi:glycosyltransferase family 4 protein [Alteromonas pelagimontana]|uniref:Glycosyltransferase family 4 protein n=2 Tax=Alteromonas pelagimontana TaxID=1858656 RepID=A0A6M4MI43_9ALTE|nr:glycosyltransferase family 4 protein [Alteromonas pelagimontana]